MEWTESLRRAIGYMEEHLLEDIHPEDVAQHVHISPFYFQRGFRLMTGYSLGEYVRCRRLYLAALELIAGEERVIDLAYRYGYETPESFTRAFSRFHGASPAQLRSDPARIRPFLPLKIRIIIQGGDSMDYVVERMEGFQVIGFGREFTDGAAYQEIPRYWDEFSEKYLERLFAGGGPRDDVDRAVCENMVGMYGVCLDDLGRGGTFRYLIAGPYRGGVVPEGMELFTFPDMEWAKFRCVGPMPGALQSVNTQIFREWLPGNHEFEIAAGANIEWYGEGDPSSPDYESAIWIPVKRK